MKRYIKQISIIGSIFLFIAGIIGLYIYLNQPEEVPPPPDPPGPDQDEILISEPQLVSNSSLWDYIVYIENPNSDWALEKFSYYLTYDGELIEDSNGESYLDVSDKKPLIINRLELTDGSKIPEIEFANLEWVELNQDLGKKDLIIKSSNYKESYVPTGKKVELVGILQNRSDYDLNEVDIHIVASNPQGQIIAVNKTVVKNITESEKRQFNVEWLSNIIDNTTEFEILATSNYYSDSNIVDSAGESRQEK